MDEDMMDVDLYGDLPSSSKAYLSSTKSSKSSDYADLDPEILAERLYKESRKSSKPDISQGYLSSSGYTGKNMDKIMSISP